MSIINSKEKRKWVKKKSRERKNKVKLEARRQRSKELAEKAKQQVERQIKIIEEARKLDEVMTSGQGHESQGNTHSCSTPPTTEELPSTVVPCSTEKPSSTFNKFQACGASA